MAAQQELFAVGAEHVWQRRFYDFNVWTAGKRIEKLRYMHRNPVARGLVQEPEQWRWSSYRSYAFEEEGAVRINQWGEANENPRRRLHESPISTKKNRKGGPPPSSHLLTTPIGAGGIAIRAIALQCPLYRRFVRYHTQ